MKILAEFSTIKLSDANKTIVSKYLKQRWVALTASFCKFCSSSNLFSAMPYLKVALIDITCQLVKGIRIGSGKKEGEGGRNFRLGAGRH
jgi:hypothetical protein